MIESKKPTQSPTELYNKASDIWVGEFIEAYIAGMPKEEKHKHRRDKLTEYLKSLSYEQLKALQGYTESREITLDAEIIQYPQNSKIRKKERATNRAILTIVTEMIEIDDELNHED